MNKTPKTWSSAFTSLALPLAFGLALYLCINLLIDREVITNELLLRYLVGHPISKITTFMFCVGVAGLLLIANNVFDQFCGCDKVRFNHSDVEESIDSSPRDRAATYLEQLYQFRSSVRGQYLWQRLYKALGFVDRTDSCSGIEDELKYLADLDLEQQQRRYALVRIVIWATPMLGFLGTVLGISQALGGIQVGPDNDFQAMLNSLRGSLFVAFDTTALALTLSMLLMFFQFFVDRFELQLLELVQRRTNEELQPLYHDSGFVDPQSRVVERIGRTVLATSHNLVKQQTDQWEQSMRSAEAAWSSSVSSMSETIRASLAESLRLTNVELADSITRGIERADKSMANRWEQWQVLLSENARQLSASQAQILKQVELLQTLIEKTENVDQSQHVLNKNLDAIALTSRLQETLQRLSDSIEDLKNQQRGRQNVPAHQHLRLHRPKNDARSGTDAPTDRKAA